jgi:dUTP pyrophosphatase
MGISMQVKIVDRRVLKWGFPLYGSPLSAGLDLFACIDRPIKLRPRGESKLISSGICVRIGDPRLCGLIVPRSGKGHADGLVLGNGVGVIDPDYEGPCMVSAWNRGGTGKSIDIQPGERIAQLIIVEIARPQFKIVGDFTKRSKRGSGGFGSSGK